MATMNISLPDKLKGWVESKVKAGDYASASDCVRDLVRQRMDYEARLALLREEIRKGDESGISDQSWEDFMAELNDGLRRSSTKAARG